MYNLYFALTFSFLFHKTTIFPVFHCVPYILIYYYFNTSCSSLDALAWKVICFAFHFLDLHEAIKATCQHVWEVIFSHFVFGGLLAWLYLDFLLVHELFKRNPSLMWVVLILVVQTIWFLLNNSLYNFFTIKNKIIK